MFGCCDGSAYDDICVTFGYPATDWNSLITFSPTAPSPFFQGPFGNLTAFNGSSTGGVFQNTTSAQVVATDLTSDQATLIIVTVGTGQAVLLSNIDAIDNTNLMPGGFIKSNDHNGMVTKKNLSFEY